MQIYFVIFALSRQIIQQKYGKTIDLFREINKVYLNDQAQGR